MKRAAPAPTPRQRSLQEDQERQANRDPAQQASRLAFDPRTLLTDRQMQFAAVREEAAMRFEMSATAISWIPSEAIEGLPKLPFELGVGHYDPPPPDQLAPGDLERLRDEDRFREANFLQAWVEVDEGRIVDHGYSGGGLVGSTTFRVGPKSIVVPGVAFETLRAEPEVGDESVRFVQTVGGR